VLRIIDREPAVGLDNDAELQTVVAVVALYDEGW